MDIKILNKINKCLNVRLTDKLFLLSTRKVNLNVRPGYTFYADYEQFAPTCEIAIVKIKLKFDKDTFYSKLDMRERNA